jgi:nucleotide-binding universal stress UspA family protein
MYHRILIPTDGSAQSEAAIPHGLALAKQLAIPVTLLHVTGEDLSTVIVSGYVPVSQEFIDQLQEELKKLGQAALDRAQALAREAGVASEAKLTEGVPAQAIVEEARSDDLVVMGTHGRGSLTAFVVGSVTLSVLHKAPCPVLAVPTRHAAK